MGAKSILVVDDDEVTRHIHCMRLGDLGFELVEARDDREALVGSRLHNLGLVLLDLRGRGQNPYRVAEELKRNPATAAVPVLIVSGSLFRDHSPGGEQRLGAADVYLGKPVNATVMRMAVLALVEPSDPAQTAARLTELQAQYSTRHEILVSRRLRELHSVGAAVADAG